MKGCFRPDFLIPGKIHVKRKIVGLIRIAPKKFEGGNMNLIGIDVDKE